MPERHGSSWVVFFAFACGCTSAEPDPALVSAAIVRGPPASASDCPPPTVADAAGSCTLERDETLTHTLRLPSFTRLNCKGHQLLPSEPGRDGAQAAFQASVPEVAILLRDVRGVVIQNCRIGASQRRFDFGVVITGTTVPEDADAHPGDVAHLRNRVLANTLQVRARGVQTFAADYVQISDNAIDYSGSRGIGTHLHASDYVLVSDNIVTGLDAPAAWFHRGVPGVDRQLGCQTCGMAVLHPTQSFPVINIIVGAELIQFPTSVGGRSVGNVFRGNAVSTPPASNGGIYVAVRSVDTLVEDNLVSGGSIGIALAGHPINSFLLLPGTCSGDAERFCGATTGDGIADHCHIAGIDAESKGVCTVRADCASLGGAPQANGTCRIDGVDGRAVDTRVVGNQVDGPASVGISVGNQLHASVTDNTLVDLATGVVVGGRSLEQGELLRNTVAAAVGLRFSQGDSQFFGARVALNDIDASTPLQLGACRFGGNGCSDVSACGVDVCGADGRCSLNTATRCSSDAECTRVNACLIFSHAAELSVGRCGLEPALTCVADSDCMSGHCQNEPTRSCRNHNECRTSDGRSPAAGLCIDVQSRGSCTAQRGNHWQRSCADSDGFRDADELARCTHDSAIACATDDECAALEPGSGCIAATDSVSPLVTDSHPFGVPVAAIPDDERPTTCQ